MVAPTHEGHVQGGQLPSQVTIEGDLVVRVAALRGAFALDPQVDPPAQTHAAAVRSSHRRAAVGRQ